jgi:hypothetical protein
MANSKRDILRAKLSGDKDKAKILELENEIERSNSQVIEEISKVVQSNEDVKDALVDLKKVTKSPACRMDEESVDECVSRKVPELLDEGYSQEQAVAIAESVCSVPCKEKIEIPKSFEIENVSDIAKEIKSAIDSVQMANKEQIDTFKLETAKTYKDIATWLEKIATKEQKVVIKKEKDTIVVDLPTSARKPIAVRLSDGDRFYNAIVSGLVTSNDGVINAINNILEKPACTYTWDGEYLSQKVAVYTDRTETTDYTWTDGKLTNKETTIT